MIETPSFTHRVFILLAGELFHLTRTTKSFDETPDEIIIVLGSPTPLVACHRSLRTTQNGLARNSSVFPSVLRSHFGLSEPQFDMSRYPIRAQNGYLGERTKEYERIRSRCNL